MTPTSALLFTDIDKRRRDFPGRATDLSDFRAIIASPIFQSDYAGRQRRPGQGFSSSLILSMLLAYSDFSSGFILTAAFAFSCHHARASPRPVIFKHDD